MDFTPFGVEGFQVDRYVQKDKWFDDFRLLPRPMASIAYILCGSWSGTQYLTGRPDHRSLNARAGELIYIPQGSVYSAVWNGDGGRPVELISLHFSLSGRFFTDRQTQVQCLSIDSDIFPAREEFFGILEEYNRRDDSVGCHLNLMKRLFGILSVVQPLLECREDSHIDRRLEPALDFIRQNPTENVTVARLAELCRLSEPHFYTLFKRDTGTSPIEYRNRVVTADAERMLIDCPELSIEEISERLGFSSSAYFRRVFGRITGCSPREYRRSGRGGVM